MPAMRITLDIHYEGDEIEAEEMLECIKEQIENIPGTDAYIISSSGIDSISSEQE